MAKKIGKIRESEAKDAPDRPQGAESFAPCRTRHYHPHSEYASAHEIIGVCVEVTLLTEPTLWDAVQGVEPISEDPRYLREQLLTYIGNKRGLLGPIATALARAKKRLGKDKLRILDAFAGSGVVSRFFKQHACRLVSNDLEEYARVVGDCYLANHSSLQLDALKEHHQRVVKEADALPILNGFVRRLYAPRCDNAIEPDDRVFYTIDNAMRIDSLRACFKRL